MPDKYTVISNCQIAKNVFKMLLRGNTEKITMPGQFINIELDGLYMRRPISVCDITGDVLTIIYKTLGKGTMYMSTLEAGKVLDIIPGLGTGFDTKPSGENPILIGGGVGVAPLYCLAKKLVAENKKPSVILGFKSKEEIFFSEEFAASGCSTFITTVDGSVGTKGFVTDALKNIHYTYVYTCGPLSMLKAVYDGTITDGQYSFEERMGCGIGACLCCSKKTKQGYKRICKDGPVLKKEEIKW